MDPLKEPQKSEVCVGVVTYFPDNTFVPRFKAISSFFGGQIIVDNCSSNTLRRDLLTYKEQTGCELILNDDNTGLAHGLNQVCEKAMELGFSWVLLLDQDSSVDSSILEHYGEIFKKIDDRDRIAIMGNNYIDQTGKSLNPYSPGQKELFTECKAVITAGSLLSLQNYRRIGRFRDAFFIDWVDTEYGYRSRKAGFKIMMVDKSLVTQRIGNPVHIPSSRGAFHTTNHAALRRYFMTRNLILLLKDYALFEPAWFFARFCDLAKTIVKISLFEKEKLPKLSAIANGFFDGVFNRVTQPKP